ncbi:flagellar biosynthetic protein FlhB [Lachnospiraceae bacterium C7]|nr:flagellar biosynthetic protein FlhB [Lachnospiraceae bacterium C7]
MTNMGEKRQLLRYNLQFFADDGGEKTEPATTKKLDDARKEGKVAKSRELTSAFDLIVVFLVIKIFVGYIGEHFLNIFYSIYGKIGDFVKVNEGDVSVKAVMGLFMDVNIQMAYIAIPFFIFGFSITALINIVQVGWKVTPKTAKPKLSKINPLSGFKRIISKDSIFELIKSIFKIGLIFIIAYTSINKEKNKIFLLYDIELKQAIALVGGIVIDTGLKISICYMIVGVADFIFQKVKFNKDMRMTKQEVKDEYKNTEGDPQIKGRQRRVMQEASQKRMMQSVPKADVVITNPTHFAVALSYDSESGKAPIVVAKGEDYLAKKIKEIARENSVEIVENKPLARTLYANVEIGEEIPPELYQAVAEILAMVYHKQENVR